MSVHTRTRWEVQGGLDGNLGELPSRIFSILRNNSVQGIIIIGYLYPIYSAPNETSVSAVNFCMWFSMYFLLSAIICR